MHIQHKEWTRLLLFLERHHKDGDNVINHIVQVSGDQTWVSFVNAELKEQSEPWMDGHIFTKHRKIVQTNVCLPEN
jgi:hypothetical protein